VLVIAVDAWRADRHAGLGQSESNLRRYARFLASSVQFRSAWSTAPEMFPAHATLISGCDPRLARTPAQLAGRFEEGEWFLPPEVPRIAESLLAAGWRTAAFVDDVRLAGPAGFAQGFQHFEDPGTAFRYRSQVDIYGVDGVARRFHEWIRGIESDEKWFAYLQLSDLDRMWSQLGDEFGALLEELPGADEPLLPVTDGPASYFTVSTKLRGDAVFFFFLSVLMRILAKTHENVAV
jgi:arylsulfatase A-like enzyme